MDDNFLLAQTVLLTIERIWFFAWWRGTSCSRFSWNPHPQPHVHIVLRALCVRYDYANYTLKVNSMEDFSLAYWITPSLAKSKDTTSTDFDTYKEYICIDWPELGSYWFSSILIWAETADENMQRNQRNSLQNSGCYKSKKISMFMLFISL